MKGAPMETEKEILLVKERLLLPVILDVLERDVRTLEAVNLKMRSVYVRNLRAVQDIVTEELSRNRRRLKECGIRVYEENRTAQELQAGYVCRGYHRRFSMLWSLVKAEIERRLSVYLDVDVKT